MWGSRRGRRTATLAISAAGLALFWVLDLPLPFLFGPMFACLAAALLGARLLGLGPLAPAARTILGVAIGAAITPELMHRVPVMAVSVSLIPVYILCIALVGVPFFHRVCGFDRATAYYAAMPGGLQDMVIFGAEAGGDARALSLIHATRVLIIVTLVPLVMTRAFGLSLDRAMGEAARDIPPVQLGLMALAALAGWKGGERIGMFGASVLGPMAVTAVLSLAGLIGHRPPSGAILTAQFVIGLGIGVGYVGVTMVELRRYVVSGVVYVFLLAILAAVFTWVVTLTGRAGALEAFLAFAPGGQAEMTILAIVGGADLGFVILHHVLRVPIVITGAPVVAHLLIGRGKPPDRRD